MHAGAFWVRTLYSDLIRLLPEAAGEWLGQRDAPDVGGNQGTPGCCRAASI